MSVREAAFIWFGSLIGLACVFLAAARSSRQPVPYSRRDEERLLQWCLDGGDMRLVGVSFDDFLSRERCQKAAERRVIGDKAVTREIEKSAKRVLSDAAERREMPGLSGFEVIDGEPPYIRRAQRPTYIRRFAGAVSGGLGTASVLFLFEHVDGANMRWAGFTAPMLLIFGGLVIALVDIDTLYLDLQTMVSVGVLSWICAAVFLFTNNRERDLLLGLAAVTVWIVSLEIINTIYKIVRKTDGVGFGDSIIVAATAGVPTAVTGDFMVGFFGVVCGFLIAGLVQIPLAISRREGARTAFALGPYLCAGWLASWYTLYYTSNFGGLS